MARDTTAGLAEYVRARRLRAGLTQEALAQRAGLALTRFWQGRGYLGEGRAWFAAVLTSPSSGELAPLLRSRLLLGARQLALWLEVTESIELLTGRWRSHERRGRRSAGGAGATRRVADLARHGIPPAVCLYVRANSD